MISAFECRWTLSAAPLRQPDVAATRRSSFADCGWLSET
jgi:hypothetical protein